jgi:hypothetical protein
MTLQIRPYLEKISSPPSLFSILGKDFFLDLNLLGIEDPTGNPISDINYEFSPIPEPHGEFFSIPKPHGESYLILDKKIGYRLRLHITDIT